MKSRYTLRVGIILLCAFTMSGCSSSEALLVQTPIETPIETPIDTPIETPIDTPADTPINTPAYTLADTSVDTPADTQETSAAITTGVDENTSPSTSDDLVESSTDSNTSANDQVVNPAIRVINFSNYQALLSDFFRIVNKEYVDDINTLISSDFGSLQPGYDDHRNNDEIVPVSGTDEYDCVLGGSFHQTPSAYEGGNITLSDCTVGAHTYSGYKDWNTSGRSGGDISYENLTALSHDGVSGFSIDGSYSSSYTYVSSTNNHYYSLVELTDIEGARTTVRNLNTSSKSKSDSVRPASGIYYSLHELRDGTFVDLWYSYEHKFTNASFTYQSPLSNNQEIDFSLDFVRDYSFYTVKETEEAVYGVEIRPVYNTCCDSARGAWITPSPPPESDSWLEGGIELNAADGSSLVISINPDDKNFIFIHINDVEEPIVTQWSELEQLGLII